MFALLYAAKTSNCLSCYMCKALYMIHPYMILIKMSFRVLKKKKDIRAHTINANIITVTNLAKSNHGEI